MRSMIVARYALGKSLFSVVVGFGFVLILAFFTIQGPPVEGLTYEAKSTRWYVFVIAGWAAVPIFVRNLVYVSLQLLTKERAAVWLEDGRIVFLNGRILSVRIDELADIALLDWTIRFRLKKGRTVSVARWYLAEPGDAVIRKLKEALPDRSPQTHGRITLGSV